jgi:Zn-dependent peptidase ImmA (M78 family)
LKYVRDTTNRFAQRPHYEAAELDRECESIIIAFLKLRHGKVEWPVSTDDLTALIEQESDELDVYADLSQYGDEVEGATIFVAGRKPKVLIGAALSEDTGRENRYRTTLTHEYGHVHFHGYLFNPLADEMDFAGTSLRNCPDGIQVCKRETILEASNADWMEWQAGHVCGAILMPATYVRRLVHQHFADRPTDQAVTADCALGRDLIAAVRQTYRVSADAARVRLLRLGLLQSTQTTTSLFGA